MTQNRKTETTTAATRETPRRPAGPGVDRGRTPEAYRHEEWQPAGKNFKALPESKELRERLNAAAEAAAERFSEERPPEMRELFPVAKELLGPLGLDETHAGFAMTALNNGYWRKKFAAVPFSRRLLLLPQCLKQAERCPAKVDETQLHCRGCGLCALADFKTLSGKLGYKTLIAEGTPAVLERLASGEADALLGVACLNVLEKAFDRVLRLGVPALAVPLLRDSCHNTAVDEDRLLELMECREAGARPPEPRGFLPLLREVVHCFEPRPLREILYGAGEGEAGGPETESETARTAFSWLRRGGKRLRPFVTSAAWRVFAGRKDGGREREIPPHVRRAAVAMEVFHKASLVHDDVEDGDDFRYGAPTVHRAHSVPTAVNLGDYLIGLGYRLLAELEKDVRAERVPALLRKIARAHVKLSEGQGAELTWRERGGAPPSALECLRLYALKTAPAFEAALYVGAALGGAPAEAAGAERLEATLAAFAKHLGAAYQIRNDLRDYRGDAENKIVAAGDLLRGGPTLPLSLAWEEADERERALLERGACCGEVAAEIRALMEKYDTPGRAAAVAEQCRRKAERVADNATPEELRALLHFLCAAALD